MASPAARLLELPVGQALIRDQQDAVVLGERVRFYLLHRGQPCRVSVDPPACHFAARK
jgi:hypothetical protein